MSRRLKDDRGAVMVISAILVPVLLVLAALIYDGGTWFTHKRQLQNRADAGALAAGVEYAARWASCGGDAATKLAAANDIDAAARQYAGDPQSVATLHNIELTDQNRVNVEINSNADGGLPGRVDPNTSWNDPSGSGLGPCDAQTRTDRFSRIAGAHYVDVGVRERDQRSLFGVFGVDLFRNEAHARVELKTIASGKGFLPIALPNQVIEQAQVRYYRECGPGAPALLATADLNPLASGYQTAPGTTLWAPTVNNVKQGTPTGITIDMPESTACSDDYIPVSTEVRIGSVPSTVIDISTKTCAYLQTATFTDCWSRVSNIRDFKDNPQTQPWFQEVTLDGGATGDLCRPDVLFARLSGTGTDCDYTVSVSIDWNDLATGRAGQNFSVSIGGDQLNPPNGPTGSPNGVWTSGGLSNNDVGGRSDLMLSWTCTKTVGGSCGSGSVPVQSLFLGDDSNASLLQLVRTSGSAQPSGGQPGAAMQWFRAGNSAQTVTIYPTVGLEAALYVGQHRVLRASGPQSNQSIDCEPNVGGQGHDFQMFATGCDPWYTFNEFAGPPWWFPGTSPPPGSCPDRNGIIAQPNGQDPSDAWQCVVKAPGSSPNVIADGIATAIGNCTNVQNNSCSRYECVNPNYYDPANPNRWALGSGEPSPRVVFLFIVPYGAYRNTPSQGGLPVLNFAAFYITGWRGSGGAGTNPCTDPSNLPPGDPNARVDESDLEKGEISGYFVDYTIPNAPGDPNSVCVIGQLRPCTPVLVR